MSLALTAGTGINRTRWKAEIIRTLFSVLFFFTIAFLMSLVQIFGDERSINASQSYIAFAMQKDQVPPSTPSPSSYPASNTASNPASNPVAYIESSSNSELVSELSALNPLHLLHNATAPLTHSANLSSPDKLANVSFQALPKLPDLGLELLPHPQGFPKWMADLALNSFVVSSLLIAILVNCLWKRQGMSGFLVVIIMVRRIFWLFGMCYLLRAFSLLGTTLPSSNPACLLVRRSGWEYLTTGPRILVGASQTCTDKIFSGHTCLAILLFWFWFVFNCGTIVGVIYAFIHSASVYICSLMCRHHYTVDIVLAIIVSSFVFHTYHLIIWVLQSQLTKRHIEYGTILMNIRPTPSDLESGMVMIQRTEPIPYKHNDSNENAPIANNAPILPTPTRRHPLHLVVILVSWVDGIDLRML